MSYCFTVSAVAENTILVLGDSLSSAYGMDASQGWVALLKARIKQQGLPYQVVNASVTGYTTSNGLAALPALLSRYHPRVTIIELGGNDGLRGIHLALIKSNLAAMVKLVQQSHSRVLLLGLRLPPNYGLTYTQQFQQIYVDLAKTGIAVISLFLQQIDQDRHYFQADQIHPTAEAEPLILDTVWPVLSPLLQTGL